MNYKISEKSMLAKIARLYMGYSKVAVVMGSTIHLSGVDKQVFLKDSKWLKHELKHVAQFEKYGFKRFIFLYLIESFRKGYYNNKFEIEARTAEQ